MHALIQCALVIRGDADVEQLARDYPQLADVLEELRAKAHESGVQSGLIRGREDADQEITQPLGIRR